MILKCTKYALLIAPAIILSACSSSSGSTSAGTRVNINSAATPINIAPQPAGAKSFTNDLGDTVTLNKAYLVLASATIETTCGATFSAAAESLLNFIIPAASAHTTATPTSTGEPHVVDLLRADGSLSNIGSLSPPADQYCGVDLDILAADADTNNLPTGAGEPDMTGKTVYIEGSYVLAGGGTGSFTMSTGATLQNRELLLSTLMALTSSNLSATINVGINYDTWFNSVDMAVLETETASQTNPLDPMVNRVLQNISASIHQL